MSKGPQGLGQLAQNPLAVIASLIAIVEAAFAYPVTKLSNTNQTIFVYFMVGFPVLLVLCFFITLWTKPGHLYSPKDYASPADFLRGIGKASAIPPQVVVAPPRPRTKAGGLERIDSAKEPNT